MCDILDCDKESRFWVQSVPSTHNTHCCSTHLVGTVRQVEDYAREFYKGSGNPDMRYARDGKRFWFHDPRANYALVTVKSCNNK